ncbi:MAG: hypothetical protein NUV53_04145 [Patescibacteria group bacterium]|nr:hypothetical protein [Patescibacteria group bacterium]
MRIAAIFALGLVIVVIGVESYQFFQEGNVLQRDFLKQREMVERTTRETVSLQSNLDYFAKPENLEKEIRARFNYRDADEKMYIIVPPHTVSSSVETPE